MALAKFFEDIAESYLEGVYPSESAGLGRDPAMEWQRTKATISDAVAVRDQSGVWWDDHLVFRAGEAVRFEIVSARVKASIKLRWQSAHSDSGVQVGERGSNRELFSSRAVSGDLHVSSGNYTKTYRVSFVAGSRPETLPDFARELAALTSNPPAWTQTSFDNFRANTDSLLSTYALPADFCDGIREYHLGLFHEQLREGRFGERLDRAYVQLLPFVPYSRIAALVCGYHLYRINAFEAPLLKGALPRIGRVARFFSQNQSGCGVDLDGEALSEPQLLIISSVDESIIAAVERLAQGQLLEATTEIENASAARCPVDTQALERITFVRHSIAMRQERFRDAKKLATLLCNSSVKSFRTLAETKAML